MNCERLIILPKQYIISQKGRSGEISLSREQEQNSHSLKATLKKIKPKT